MTTVTVRDPFYFGGKIRDVGEPIEVTNDADRKSLLDRGMVSEGGPASEAKQLPDPDNKRQQDPQNKAGRGAGKGAQA